MTQAQTVARHMIKYGEITRNTAIGMYRITRLAAVAHTLSKAGIPIVAEPVMKGKKLVDYRYAYRSDYLARLRAFATAQELMQQFRA